METNEIKNLKNLQELARKQFKTLETDTYTKDLFTVKFNVIGYKDLLFVISDLIKLSICAIEQDSSYDSATIVNSKVNITNILEIAIQLLPIDEAEFLDESRELFLNENSNNIPENQNS
jgi:hypothetical protein